MTSQIIHLTPNQWPIYKDLRLEALQTEPTAFLTSYETAAKYPDEEWRKRLEKAADRIYFASVDNQMAGMAGYSFGEAPKTNHTVEIWGVYVKLQYRGQGVAKQILNSILSDLDQNPDILKAGLGVVETQSTAQKLYLTLGFKAIGTQQKQYHVNGKYYDEILMEKMIH